MRRKGYVFVLTNKFMKNIVIIGYSYKQPEKLAYAISRSTGVPVDYSVSLVKKTDSPVDDYKAIKSSIKNIIKEKGSVAMVECSSEKFLRSMRSEFGFSYRAGKNCIPYLVILFVISVFFIFLWYYNFFGLR